MVVKKISCEDSGVKAGPFVKNLRGKVFIKNPDIGDKFMLVQKDQGQYVMVNMTNERADTFRFHFNEGDSLKTLINSGFHVYYGRISITQGEYEV